MHVVYKTNEYFSTMQMKYQCPFLYTDATTYACMQRNKSEDYGPSLIFLRSYSKLRNFKSEPLLAKMQTWSNFSWKKLLKYFTYHKLRLSRAPISLAGLKKTGCMFTAGGDHNCVLAIQLVILPMLCQGTFGLPTRMLTIVPQEVRSLNWTIRKQRETT